jgi:HEPN domain-containing protein
MSKWSFKEDFKKTDWKATLIYNLERAAAAGIVAIIIGLFLGEKIKIIYVLFGPIVWPLVYITILLPLGLVTIWLSNQGVPFIGLVTFVISFSVFVGDPLVWFANIVLPPRIIPVEKVKFINFALIVFLMKPEPGELDESMEVSTFDSVQSADIQPDSKLVQPLNISQRTEAGPRTPGLEQDPGYAESVITKSLIDQAVLLEAKGDEESIEKAHILWEQALKIGGLSARDDLLCHYYLGPYYQSKENLAEAIKHNERIAISDPNLTFLNERDDTVRILLRADLYKSLSAAYQFHARTAIKEHEGLKSAIGYIERKLRIIGSMAAPSLLLELGSYYGLAGASGTLERALEAPSYGSEFQEAAKTSASDFLKEEAAAKATIYNRDEISKAEKPLILDTEAAAKKSPAMKWAIGGVMGVAAVFAFILLLQPSQYKKYYSKAQEAFKNGNYSEALTLVNLAKEEKSTTETNSLDSEIRQKFRDIEVLAEQQKKQKEYETYYRKALDSYNAGNYDDSLRFAQRASEYSSTQDLKRLTNNIQTRIREQRQREQDAQRVAETGRQETRSPITMGSSLANLSGNWEFAWDGRGARLPISIAQDGKVLRIQMSRDSGSGRIDGDEVSWTITTTSSQGRNTMIYTGKIQENRMFGWATLIRVSASGGSRRLSPRGWTATRKIG